MTSQPSSAGAAFHERSVDDDAVACAARTRASDQKIARRAAKVLFTLALAGVFASIAVPNGVLLRPQCRGKQSEAKYNLRALYVAQEAYRAEFDRYSDDARALGWEPRGVRIRYDYFVALKNHDDADPANDGVELWAVGMEDEVVGDVWRNDESRVVRNVVNACAL